MIYLWLCLRLHGSSSFGLHLACNQVYLYFWHRLHLLWSVLVLNAIVDIDLGLVLQAIAHLHFYLRQAFQSAPGPISTTVPSIVWLVHRHLKIFISQGFLWQLLKLFVGYFLPKCWVIGIVNYWAFIRSWLSLRNKFSIRKFCLCLFVHGQISRLQRI